MNQTNQNLSFLKQKPQTHAADGYTFKSDAALKRYLELKADDIANRICSLQVNFKVPLIVPTPDGQQAHLGDLFVNFAYMKNRVLHFEIERTRHFEANFFKIKYYQIRNPKVKIEVF